MKNILGAQYNLRRCHDEIKKNQILSLYKYRALSIELLNEFLFRKVKLNKPCQVSVPRKDCPMKYFKAMIVGWMRVRKMVKRNKAKERKRENERRRKKRRNTGREPWTMRSVPSFGSLFSLDLSLSLSKTHTQ